MIFPLPGERVAAMRRRVRGFSTLCPLAMKRGPNHPRARAVATRRLCRIHTRQCRRHPGFEKNLGRTEDNRVPRYP